MADELPREMTYIRVDHPGGPEVLAADPAGPAARAGRDPDPGARRRRQPAGRAAARGQLPAAARRLDVPGLEVAGEVAAAGPGGSRWRVGDARHARCCAAAATPSTAPRPGRRPCRCRGPRHGRGRRRCPRPSSPSGPTSSTAAACAAARAARPRRLLAASAPPRSSSPRARRPRLRDRRHRGEVRGLPRRSAPSSPSTTARRTSSRRCKRGDRRPRRRRDPRHGRRRLPRRENIEALAPDGRLVHDRALRAAEGRAQLRPGHAQAPDA